MTIGVIYHLQRGSQPRPSSETRSKPMLKGSRYSPRLVAKGDRQSEGGGRSKLDSWIVLGLFNEARGGRTQPKRSSGTVYRREGQAV